MRVALDFVQQASVIDNPDNQFNVIQGIPMLAHSYLAIVLPDTLTGLKRISRRAMSARP